MHVKSAFRIGFALRDPAIIFDPTNAVITLGTICYSLGLAFPLILEHPWAVVGPFAILLFSINTVRVLDCRALAQMQSIRGPIHAWIASKRAPSYWVAAGSPSEARPSRFGTGMREDQRLSLMACMIAVPILLNALGAPFHLCATAALSSIITVACQIFRSRCRYAFHGTLISVEEMCCFTVVRCAVFDIRLVEMSIHQDDSLLVIKDASRSETIDLSRLNRPMAFLASVLAIRTGNDIRNETRDLLSPN